MLYQLSKRQLKELANGKLLRIAVPAPDGEIPADLVEWARSVLEVAPQCVRRARLTNVWCVRSEDKNCQVEYQIGRILRDNQEAPQGQIPYSVEVILVDLAERVETRGSYPAQWPGTVET